MATFSAFVRLPELGAAGTLADEMEWELC